MIITGTLYVIFNRKGYKMRKLILALAIMLFGISAFAQTTSDLLTNYISVKDALVNSDSKSALQATNVMYQTLIGEENFVENDELLKAVEKLSKANNIEKQRTAFKDVSTAMWRLVKSSDQIAQAVYYLYCPMKKANWLSFEKSIKNPYYGYSMLTCGNLEEMKN